MNIIALEVSTSSAKAILYSSEKGVLGVAGRPYKEPVSDVVTQDPEGVYRASIECAKSLLKSTPCEVDAIGLSSTWHSLLCLDEKRNPIGPTITWANTEAAETVVGYRDDEGLGKWLYRRTGCLIHSMYPLWKWVHKRKKGEVGVDRRAFISSQPEYIFEKLTGEIGVSHSVASGTGLMNIHTLEWDQEILEFAGIDREQLAPLRDPEYTAPLLKGPAEEIGVKAGIPVVITGPDGALNQVGSGALGRGVMTMSVGTSGALRIAYDHPVIPEYPSTWCYYAAEGKRLAGAATSGAGNCIEWFIQKVNRSTVDYDMLDKMIDDINPGESPVFLPFLYGERCPGWEDTRTGGYFGLKGFHETGHMYYAVLEGILFNLYQCYRILVQVGEVPKEIRISGGIENSPRWLQMAADIFQREIYTSKVEHASTMGAVALALKAMGLIKNLSEFEAELGHRVEPDEERTGFYRERFEKYMEWYVKTSDRGEISG